jgi:hypothetical protein
MTPKANGYLPGLVAAADLDAILVFTLLHGACGVCDFTNHTYEAARVQAEAEQRVDWEDHCESMADQVAEAGCVLYDFEFDEHEFANSYRPQQETVSGTLDHVQYRSCWLDGALHFVIERSPLVATKAERHPSIRPAAGVLRYPAAREGVELAFDVPPAWWHVPESETTFNPLENI